MPLKVSLVLEEFLKGQQRGGAQGVGGILVAGAPSPVGGATGGEGVGLRVVEDEGRREGGGGRRACHHGRAQRLEVHAADVVVVDVVAGDPCRGVEGLPVLGGRVQGAGEVHLGHGARHLHLRLGQQVQRLLKGRGVIQHRRLDRHAVVVLLVVVVRDRHGHDGGGAGEE